jgi:hypothetical protein
VDDVIYLHRLTVQQYTAKLNAIRTTINHYTNKI